ncbi:hypothetical protein BpHYR1_038222 [Brachionus plicatilis]|uniref:Uncharacterized protein n=1 Tax=Brachionus plicatilis TaxID=10195 RepID=A0A3M7SIL9_BRAPC|nr:hypothetical protein BpHYR1_038222 [Brachionus plicatilis]
MLGQSERIVSMFQRVHTVGYDQVKKEIQIIISSESYLLQNMKQGINYVVTLNGFFNNLERNPTKRTLAEDNVIL